MDNQTTLIMLLVAVVGLLAFLLGERRAMKRAAAESSSPEESAREPKPSESGRDDVAEASGPVSSGSPKPPTVVPVQPAGAHAGGAAAAEDPPAIDWEDDEAIDPTKVGPAASAPPSQRVIIKPPVKAIVFDEEASTDEIPHTQPFFLVSATAQTDKGLRRKRNEDSLGVLEKKNLFVVADGMGGYVGGEHASRLSVDTIMEAFGTNTFEGSPHDDLPREASDLARAIQMANASIKEEAQRQHSLQGMGTTLVSAVFSPNKRRMYIGHVGDSRCYRLRENVLTQMTADHTMAELGVKGPEGQQLSRAVGIWPTVPIDILKAAPQVGDSYLLCSDGLTKMLPDDVIGNVLRNEEDPKAAVERLILFANSRGGKDNITAILIKVVPTDWKPKASEPFRPASSAPPSSTDPRPKT